MVEISYLDFDMMIERSGEKTYRARVLSSPAGQASGEISLPFSDLELENFLLKIGRTRRGVRRLESPEMEAAKVFGGKLFKAVFEDELFSALRSSLDEARKQRQGLRIRLRLNDAPELVNLPWEYLYNPSLNRFLSLSVNTPLIRYLELPERISPLLVTLPLRVLAVISSPSDYPGLDVEREWNNLNAALADLIQRGVLLLDRLETATPTALQYSLRRNEYHIFHFIGHGGFNEQAQDGILLFEEEGGRGRPLSGQYLGTLLHDEDTLRLAVLNACEGGRSGMSDPFAGVAQSLVQQGLPAVIGMQFEVTDQAAITFAREFYTAIADGYPVDAALSEARKAIFSLGNDIEWGTPVLYMRAQDGMIFDVSKLPETAQGPQPAAEEKPPSHPPAEGEHLIPPTRAKTYNQVNLEQLYIDGLSAYWLQDWAKAWDLFRQVVDLNPAHQDASAKLDEVKEQLTKAALLADAELAMQANDWSAAQEPLEKLVELDSDYNNASSQLEQVRKNIQLSNLYAQAQQLHQAEQWAAVINVFNQIKEIQPDYLDPDELLSSAQEQAAEQDRQQKLQNQYLQAMQAMEDGRWQEADKLFSEVKTIDPDYRDTHLLLVRVAAEIKKEIAQSHPEEPISISYTPAQTTEPNPILGSQIETTSRERKRLPRWAVLGLGGLGVAVVLGAYLLFGGGGGNPSSPKARSPLPAAIEKPPEIVANTNPTSTPSPVDFSTSFNLTPSATSTLSISPKSSLPGVETIPLSQLLPTIPWMPPNIQVFSTYTETTRYTVQLIHLNPNFPSLNDPLVRQALASAIDRDSLVAGMKGIIDNPSPATSFLHPSLIGRDLTNQVGLPFDPQKARQLLAKAGYPGGSGFPQLEITSSDTEEYDYVIWAIVKMWHEYLGIDIQPNFIPMPVSMYISGNPADSTPLFGFKWIREIRDPNLIQIFTTNADANLLHLSYLNFDSLVREADQNASNLALRQELYIQADRIITEEEAIVIPLYYETWVDKDYGD